MRRALLTSGAALALAAWSPPAHAVAPTVRLAGSAALTRLSATGGGVARAARFHVIASFGTDTPGAPLFTIQHATVYFPDHAGTNGPLFPSCSARQIERFHGDLRRCPRGSQVGSGTARAQALGLGVTATARVAIFNGARGRSATFNFRVVTPANIDESLDAPITQLHGIYGEKVTLTIPQTLQEIIGGVFVGVERFDVTLGGAVRAHGVEQSYLKAPTCPRQAMHGVFDFVDGATGQTATATADAKVHCTR